MALVLLLLGLLSACSGSGKVPSVAQPRSSSTTPRNVTADSHTDRLAALEAVRQCQIAHKSFPKEADIDSDLDHRLAAIGYTHLQWKDWHDELATSPALANQLAAQLRATHC